MRKFIFDQLQMKQSIQKEDKMLVHVLENAKKGDANSVIECIDKFCWESKSNWMMNIGDVKGKLLDNSLIEQKPKIALEMGTYCGYSSIRIGRLMKPGSTLISIDVNPETSKIAQTISEFSGLGKINHYWLGGLEPNIERLKKEVGQLDFVFFDHVKGRYLTDLLLLEKNELIKKGSCLFGDNILYPGAPHYRKYVNESEKYQTKEFETELEYIKPAKKDIVTVSIFQG